MKRETIISNVSTCCVFIMITYLFFSVVLWDFNVFNWTLSARVVTLILFVCYILYARHRIVYEYRAIEEVEKFLKKDEE